MHQKILIEWTLHLGILVFGTLRGYHLRDHLIHKQNVLGTFAGLTPAAFRSPYNHYSYRKQFVTENYNHAATFDLICSGDIEKQASSLDRDWLFHSKHQRLVVIRTYHFPSCHHDAN